MEKSAKIDLLLGLATIVGTILAPIISSSYLFALNSYFGETFKPLTTSMFNTLATEPWWIFQVIYISIYMLVYYLWEKKVTKVIGWYGKIIRTHKVELEEMNVSEHLTLSMDSIESNVSSLDILDPVCNMIVDEKNAQYISEAGGKKVYLCSAACKTEFERDPAKYGFPSMKKDINKNK